MGFTVQKGLSFLKIISSFYKAQEDKLDIYPPSIKKSLSINTITIKLFS